MQIDLTAASGLPISLDLKTGELTATGDVDLGDQGERRLSQLREVLEDPTAATDDRICYRTYRGVGTKTDLELLEEHGLRYDITVTLPGVIGREFTKTAGHYHAVTSDGIFYPEIYEVVHGNAAFVLQSELTADLAFRDTWVQICRPGDRILIPGELGHVTVNIESEPVVVCDLIASACTNDYESFQALRGAAHYVVANGDGFVIEPNRHYTGWPPAIVDHGTFWPPFWPNDTPLIEMFRRDPDVFRPLTTPWELDEKL